MHGTWEYMLHKENKVRAIVMNFPEAFDTLNHHLLCKIKTYGFDKNTLTLIQSYFSYRHQIIIKIGDTFSKWKKISTDVPHVSILGPIFFSTFH